MNKFKKGKYNKKGFTLVEILIVIVILAIMATLIIPRMVAQTAIGDIAQAQHMLGAMRRAQNQIADKMDAGALANWIAIASTDTQTPGWDKLKLTYPAPGTGNNWKYYCDNTNCYAYNQTNGGTIALNSNGDFTCTTGGIYVAAGTSKRGCRLA